MFLRKFRYGEKGFTLIELLIVIAILGVLAAVVVPNVQRFTKSGLKAAAMQEKETIQTAVDAGMAEAGATALFGDLPIGPTDNPEGLYEVIKSGPVSTGVCVGDFLRRKIEGVWIVDATDGIVKSGHFKAGEDGWTYVANPESWTWEAAPAP